MSEREERERFAQFVQAAIALHSTVPDTPAVARVICRGDQVFVRIEGRCYVLAVVPIPAETFDFRERT